MVQQALVVSQLIDSMSFIKIYTTPHCFKLSALHYFSSINVSALDSYCFVGRDFQFSFFFGFNFVFLSWFMYGCQCLNSVLILKFMLMLGVFLFLFCILDLIEL